MKKSLFLLPILAAATLCGCNNGTGGGGGGGGGGSKTLGDLIAKVEMSKPSETGTKVSADEYTFSKDSCKVTVKTYKNTQQNVETAVSASGNYEMRLYNKFLAVCSCSEKFSGIKFISTDYSDSKYVYDDPNLDDATFEFDGKVTTTIYLNSSSTEFEIYAYKQIRVAAIEFYK